MGEDEQDSVKRPIDVSYYLEVNGRPHTAFHGLIELEKMNGVKFLKGKSYENEKILYKTPLSVCFSKTWKS